MAVVAITDAQVAALIVAGTDPDVAGIHQALSVCGIPQQDRLRLINEGFVSLWNLRDYSSTELDGIAKQLQGRPQATRVQLGINALKNLKALVYWIKDNQRRNITSFSVNFTAATMHEMRDRMQMDSSKLGDTDVSVLSKCNPKKFKQSKLEFINHLKTTKGQTGITLAYVIRADNVDPANAVDDDERMMWQAPLRGVAYAADNKVVYMKAERWVIGTDAYTWFQEANINDGRSAVREIINHYEGVGEINKKVSAAEASLKTLHYKKEGVFTVETYVTRLKESFTDLKDSAEGYTERKMVTTMLDGIQNSDAKMESIKTMIRVMHAADFKEACDMLLTQVSEVYKGEIGNSNSGRKRGISSVHRNNNRGRGGGRGGGRFRRGGRSGRGRGGRGGGGRGRGGGGRHNNNDHGVNISDVTRDFSRDEWTRLGNAGMLSHIHTQRGILANGGSAAQPPGDGQRGIGAVNQVPAPAPASAPAPAPDTNTQNGPSAPSGRGPQNGGNFGHGRYRNNDRYDANGNRY